MDVDADGFRPIFRINVVDRSFEGPMNSSPSPPRCWTVDNDLNNYKSDGDHPMNMEDDYVHMKDVSSNLQDVEEDYGAAVRQSFDYRMEKSCTKLLKEKCLSPSCGWLLWARKYETSDIFHIYKYVGMHTCGVEHATRKHKKMSSELIASLCVNHFRDGNSPSISEIQRIVFKELHCHASYWMCWNKSVIAKNIIHGTPEHGYACLPVFPHMVELLNPGSSYSIMGYAHMRKVIVVDGTYLYRKYGGVLLSAVAQDTENHIFPIVFCVIDKENDASWTFFFQKLKSIVEDEPYLHVIFNRNISITNAFSRVYSRAHHGLCMRHLAENLHVNQHCGEHLYLFYTEEKAYSLDEFSKNFEKLKYNSPEAAYVLENFRERYAYVDGEKNIFLPCTEKILRDNKSESDSLYMTNPNGVLDQYAVFDNGVNAKVNLFERSFSC
ncbi:uncharacterized protein LOC124890510 [Capsicum annuum]|uniref:uncharacterized protein LOC124890510 n=1 Tax=Capsicum annuum TaxID=4072 RepID=UPI001FB077DB|nr:uncharacterized protein LOC124890510 [Capsicum annuum]